MPISKLDIKNFQGFSSTQTIELKPLTMIFGPNSSGKSSIFRALSLLQQSAFTPKRSNRLSPYPVELMFQEPRGKDYGSFLNVVNDHIDSNEISFTLEIEGTPSWILSRASKVRTDIDEALDVNHSETIAIRFNLKYLSPGLLTELHISILDIGRNAISNAVFSFGNTYEKYEDGDVATEIKLIDCDSGFEQTLLDFLNYEGRTNSLIKFLPARSSRKNDLTEKNIQETLRNHLPLVVTNVKSALLFGEAYGINAPRAPKEIVAGLIYEVFRDLGFSFRTALREVNFIDSLRNVPPRVSNLDSRRTESIDRDGSNIVRWLHSHADRVRIISELMNNITNGRYSLQTTELKIDQFDYLRYGALQLIENSSGTRVSFEDVGVGLSQLLPILAQMTFFKMENPTLAIEQPELHLHPRMQAELMDLLIETSEFSNNWSKKILLETHSEPMLMRLQKRIREGKIDKSYVSVAYVEAGVNGSEIKMMELNDDGSFKDRWPVSFSGLRREDSF